MDDELEVWRERLALTCPGCGLKAIDGGICTVCGASKGVERLPTERTGHAAAFGGINVRRSVGRTPLDRVEPAGTRLQTHVTDVDIDDPAGLLLAADVGASQEPLEPLVERLVAYAIERPSWASLRAAMRALRFAARNAERDGQPMARVDMLTAQVAAAERARRAQAAWPQEVSP